MGFPLVIAAGVESFYIFLDLVSACLGITLGKHAGNFGLDGSGGRWRVQMGRCIIVSGVNVMN